MSVLVETMDSDVAQNLRLIRLSVHLNTPDTVA